MRSGLAVAALVGGLAAGSAAAAPGTYQTAEDFVAESFAGAPPAPRLIWLADARGAAVAEILGHPPATLRLRYWARAGRSAWVLEEIGKERLITAGFVVERGRIVRARVLAFRESRGWEVRAPAWLAQFEGRALDADRRLDGAVDGISGATLSVSALVRMARLALYLAAEAERVDG